MHGIEHRFSITLRTDNLANFMNEWEQALSGLEARPADAVLEAVFLRQLRQCAAMGDDVWEYERHANGDALRSYEGLMRAVKRQVERMRAAKDREAFAHQLAGGNATPAQPPGKGQGKDGNGSPQEG